MENTVTEIEEQEYEPDNTNIFDELIAIRKEILKGKMNIQKIAKANAEITRDSGLMKMKLLINRLCYANNFTDFEQKIAVYLLDGQTDKETLEGKFTVLKELLMVRRYILDVIGEIEEEIKEEENEGEQENE